MNQHSNGRDLTEKQLKFVDAYMGECSGDASAAYTLAYDNVSRANAYTVKHHPLVIAEIERRQDLRKIGSWFNEEQVLQGLLDEAQSHDKGSNSSSRISAWVWIGKHIGMWREKKEEKGDQKITYNVVNYNSPLSSPTSPEEKEIESPPQEIDGVTLVDFKRK